MAFLRSSTPDEIALVAYGRGVMLRPPVGQDFETWAALRGASQQHLQPWEPQWANDELSRAAFRRRLRVYARDVAEDHGYAFFLFRHPDQTLLGGVTLSNVRRGVAQTASMGYWIGAGYSGRGYMTEAVRTMVRFSFEHLRLHRIEAACLPHNLASTRVLQKCGFHREGYAHRYLKINGQWQDHVLFGLTDDDERRQEGR